MTLTTKRAPLPLAKIFAASVGNALEWFDWTVYATFSIYFADQFFPKGHSSLAIVNVFATYALAFFFRPLGGVLLGRFADVRGRKPAMILTIVMLTGGSVLIGVLPGFELIGWFAPVLLLLLRIVQGLALGGEVSNSSAYLAEIAPNDQRGRYGSFFYLSTGFSVLLASLLGFAISGLLSNAQLHSFGWRIPFLVGGLLGLVGLWIRRALSETELFERNRIAAVRVPHPLLTTLRAHPKAVGQVIGYTMLATICFYTFFTAITPFAVKTRGADATEVFAALSLATVIWIVLQYPMGVLSDRIGRRPQLLVWSAAIAILIVPLSFLVRPGFLSLFTVFTVGLVFYSAASSLAPALLSELFPTTLRALGIGAWYNLTVAVFGGTAPLVINALSAAGAPIVFFYYVAAVAVIAFIAVYTLPRSNPVELP